MKTIKEFKELNYQNQRLLNDKIYNKLTAKEQEAFDNKATMKESETEIYKMLSEMVSK